MKLRGFDLFSGIGGFRAGIDSAFKGKSKKVDWVGWCDFDKYAQQTYRACFNTHNEQFISDITDVTGPLTDNSGVTENKIKGIDKKLIDFDLLTAGFPCQAFSSLGKRKGMRDERGTLFYSIELILMAKRPEYFILENVSGLKTVDNGKTFEKILSVLKKKLSYNVVIWMLNTRDYGVPQNRRRVFIVGSKNKNRLSDEIPPEKIKKRKYPTARHLLEKNVDQKYYLSEKIKKTIVEPFPQFNENPIYNLDVARCLTRTMHKMHRCSQDNYYSDDYITGINSEKRKNRIRRITPKEGFRLQGFNEKYINKALSSGVSDTQLYMQIGNSVPPVIVNKIIKKLLTNE